MVQHTIFVKLRDEAPARTLLDALRTVPHSTARIAIATPNDDASAHAWDCFIRIHSPTRNGVDDQLRDPAWTKAFAELRHYAIVVKAWTFDDSQEG